MRAHRFGATLQAITGECVCANDDTRVHHASLTPSTTCAFVNTKQTKMMLLRRRQAMQYWSDSSAYSSFADVRAWLGIQRACSIRNFQETVHPINTQNLVSGDYKIIQIIPRSESKCHRWAAIGFYGRWDNLRQNMYSRCVYSTYTVTSSILQTLHCIDDGPEKSYRWALFNNWYVWAMPHKYMYYI